MSFQKCPICNGSGSDPYITLGSQLEYPCPTCRGARIIDDVTGIPPVLPEKHNLFENLTSTYNVTTTHDVSHISGE